MGRSSKAGVTVKLDAMQLHNGRYTKLVLRFMGASVRIGIVRIGCAHGTGTSQYWETASLGLAFPFFHFLFLFSRPIPSFFVRLTRLKRATTPAPRNLKKSHNHDMNGSGESGGDFITSFPNCVSSARPLDATKAKEGCFSGGYLGSGVMIMLNLFFISWKSNLISPTRVVLQYPPFFIYLTIASNIQSWSILCNMQTLYH